MSKHTTRLCVATVSVMLVAAGCGSSGSGPGVPTAGGSSRTQAAAGTSDLDQDMIDYVHCMRGQGVTISDPAPRPGHTGLSLSPPDLSTPGVRAADGQCKHFLAPINAYKARGAHDRLTPAVMSALLSYSRCMRSHDIPLEDPSPDDGHVSMGNIAGLNSDIGRQDPLFHSADSACRHLLPASVPDDGTGPP
jgi:hypothetical protein